MRNKSIFLRNIAKMVSTIGNPVVIGLFYGVYIQYISLMAGHYDFMPIIFTLLMIAPTAAFIYWKVKKKEYTDYDVSNRVKRNSLYNFVLPLIFILNITLFIFNFPIKVKLVAATFLLNVSIATILNKTIKASMHTSFCFLFANLFYPINIFIAVFLFFSGFLVLWSRVFLNRHSVKEVVAGFILGNSLGGIYLFFYDYFVK
jgi:membrane-associated phospholipid phosphatase